MNFVFRSLYFFSILCCLFTTKVDAHTPPTFSNIISFGDSLTDVGNVAGLTAPGFSPVINGYYKETHFSDNIIWIEILADYLALAPRTPGRGDSTTLTPQPYGNTWAWGGSEAAKGSVSQQGVSEAVPNLLLEVEQYLAVNKPDPNFLYVIWSGADNLLIGGKFGLKEAKKAVKAVATAVRLLKQAGARNFLVFNLPKLGDTPSAQEGGLLDEAAANIYSLSYNKALKHVLKKLENDKVPEAAIYSVDVYSELVLVVDTVKGGQTYTPSFFVPGAPVAISNVTDEALTYFNDNGTFPTNYLFWDDVHPTTQGHQVLAGLVLQALNEKRHSKKHHH